MFGTFPMPCKLERRQTGNSRTVSAILLRNLVLGTSIYENTLHTLSKYQIRHFRIRSHTISVSHKQMQSREREKSHPLRQLNKQHIPTTKAFQNFHSFSLCRCTLLQGHSFLLLQTRFWLKKLLWDLS